MRAASTVALLPILALSSRLPAHGQTLPAPERPAASHAVDPHGFAVVGVSPTAWSKAPVGSAIRIDFDEAVDPASVTPTSLRVFGAASGPHAGTLSWSNGKRTLTFQPSVPFRPGELVRVSVSHDLASAPGGQLREAGYTWRFHAAVAPSTGTFTHVFTIPEGGPDPTFIASIVPVDMDLDGWLDLVAVHGGNPNHGLRVYLNAADGSGAFAALGPIHVVQLGGLTHRTADFDADGLVDLCFAGSNLVVAFGDGLGGFAHVDSIDTPPSMYDVGVLDLDGDGDDDLLSPSLSSPQLATLINDGDGNFTSGPPVDHGMAGCYHMAESDLDGDGVTDLSVFSNNFGTQYSTILGTDEGGWEMPAFPAATLSASVKSLPGDANGDGLADVAIAGYHSDSVSILRGKGNGTFGPIHKWGAGESVIALDLEDIDGDSDLDMAVSAGFLHRVRIYRNTGLPVFQNVAELPTPSFPTAVALFDFDGDGDLDLAVGDEDTRQILIYRND